MVGNPLLLTLPPSWDLFYAFTGSQTSSAEVLSPELDDFRDLYPGNKSSPYRSSEFLSTEQNSPEVSPSDIDTTLTSDSQQITSSRSSLTSNNDAISPRQEAYLEGNPVSLVLYIKASVWLYLLSVPW